MSSRTRKSAGLLGLVTGVGLGVSWLAWEASAEPAVDATRTGEIIGAASACGAGAGDLLGVGQVVIGWARSQARTPVEMNRARTAHERAVMRAAAQIEKEGPAACPAAMARFRDLQKEAEAAPPSR